MGSERITKRLRQIPNAWHFSFYRWVSCLRWYGYVLWWRCSLLNAALGISGNYLETNIMKDILKPVLDDNEEILWVGKPYF
ncbi:hypothetical protein WOC18_24455, partial [Vibrio parahaemolyticus]